MKRIVARGLLLSLGFPCLESLPWLHESGRTAHVEDRCRVTGESCLGSGFVVVLRIRAHEGEVYVGVWVKASIISAPGGGSMLRSMRVMVWSSHQMSATYLESLVTISPLLINRARSLGLHIIVAKTQVSLCECISSSQAPKVFPLHPLIPAHANAGRRIFERRQHMRFLLEDNGSTVLCISNSHE